MKYSRCNNHKKQHHQTTTMQPKTTQRIFFPHVNILNVKDEYISSYKTNQSIKKMIYSPEGVFEIYENTIWKMMPNDVYIDNSNNGKFLVDKSVWEKKSVWHQIPFNHVCVITTKYVYKLSPKSMVDCVIEKNEQGDIVDFYMETDFSINVKGIKEDILTFLSELNF